MVSLKGIVNELRQKLLSAKGICVQYERKNIDPAAIREEAQRLEGQLRTWRRDLHAHPESAWTEYRTASIVIQELQALGYTVIMGAEAQAPEARRLILDAENCAAQRARAIAEGADAALVARMSDGLTGLWAEMSSFDDAVPEASEPVCVALRFDMDCNELTECAEDCHRPHHEGFASCRSGFMHACGHDGHVALGLGVARLLAQTRSHWRGRIRLIFQPAEEGGTGAEPMLAAGAVRGVDYLIGMHLGIQARQSGELICGTDAILATSNFEVIFSGRAAHAGMAPQEGRNALLAACVAVQGMHAISRHGDALTRINVGQMRAGDAPNIIPAQAWLRGETRGLTTAANEYMMAEVRRIAESAAAMWGCTAEVHLLGNCPGAASGKELTDAVENTARSMGTFTHIRHTASFQASEDFTWLMDAVEKAGGESVYMMLGARHPSGHHTSRFDFDEDVLPSGVALLALLAMRCLDMPKRVAGL